MMIWQTARFRIDLSVPRDGHRQRHAGLLLRRRAHALPRQCALRIASAAGRAPHPGHRRRIHPPRRPPCCRWTKNWRVCCPWCARRCAGRAGFGGHLQARGHAAVLDLGADIINDIWALAPAGRADGRGAHAGCGVCLMHMHREPQTMQVAHAGDVVPRCWPSCASGGACRRWGWPPTRIVLDPGIGFGKTVEQNFSLLARQAELLAGRLPAAGGLVAQVVAGGGHQHVAGHAGRWTCRPHGAQRRGRLAGGRAGRAHRAGA
jgi:hypothetical protein